MNQRNHYTSQIDSADQILSEEIFTRRLKELFDYEAKTGVFTRKVTVSANAKKGRVAGCPAKNGYLRIRIDGKYYYNHRLAWVYEKGEMPSGDIDHINGARSDNRILNLRPASRSENLQNRAAKGVAKSGLIGAYLDKNTGRWYSKGQCLKTGRQVGLGHYDTKHEAHEAYKKWKRDNHAFQPELRE